MTPDAASVRPPRAGTDLRSGQLLPDRGKVFTHQPVNLGHDRVAFLVRERAERAAKDRLVFAARSGKRGVRLGGQGMSRPEAVGENLAERRKKGIAIGLGHLVLEGIRSASRPNVREDAMSDQYRSVQDAMADRLSLVCRVSELNGRLVQLTQAAGGADFELLSAEDDADALGRRDAAQSALMACEADIDALEARIASIDRELAAWVEPKG